MLHNLYTIIHIHLILQPLIQILKINKREAMQTNAPFLRPVVTPKHSKFMTLVVMKVWAYIISKLNRLLNII